MTLSINGRTYVEADQKTAFLEDGLDDLNRIVVQRIEYTRANCWKIVYNDGRRIRLEASPTYMFEASMGAIDKREQEKVQKWSDALGDLFPLSRKADG